MKYPEVRNYVGGSFVGTDRPFIEVINPSDGSVISRVPLSTQDDVDAAVASAAKAFPPGPRLRSRSASRFSIGIRRCSKTSTSSRR